MFKEKVKEIIGKQVKEVNFIKGMKLKLQRKKVKVQLLLS